ncbi:NRDE family protein [Halomonas sp. ANAO-440]|uniref:NRDE family protein n=1 Tax=Halomonas sp. ANAO-440 TaxID=2861360 RepID=UPI001CAA7B04|nr:NRDE family protein [Halomonas sp. ANAO-440]MBZ0328756.1 NRDE family protein [Halomonas sp. ANAO-440]
MCLIAFDYRPGCRFPLRLVANRDEFYQRPSAPLGQWQEAPDIVGGRDLEAGGSWLAVHRRGRFAAVTNVRDPELKVSADAPSRGYLVREALEYHDLAGWLKGLADGEGWRYAGFNLLVGEMDRLWHLHRGRDRLVLGEVTPGVHGLSNAGLNTPWPKLIKARQGVVEALRCGRWPEEALAALSDASRAEDDQLPDTGISLELERLLSAPFIVGEQYGTRAMSWLEWDAERGAIRLGERRFGPGGMFAGENEESVALARQVPS